MNELTVYTDGSCNPNPGYGAWCAVIVKPENPVVLSGTETNTTNNAMELMGIIRVLETLPTVPHKVTLHSDSMYVVNAINRWMVKWEKQGWKRKEKRGLSPVKNLELFLRLAQLRKIHKLEAVWVKGHNGDPYNEHCDMIANQLVTDYYLSNNLPVPQLYRRAS